MTLQNPSKSCVSAPKKDTVIMNEKIKCAALEVIDENGVHLGNLSRQAALKIASDKNLDLVVIAVQNKKVIAKILDYGKFKFDQKRKQKAHKKNQQTATLKEIKVKPLIGEHDLLVKAQNAKKWLANGDRVKFVIEARGRLANKHDYIHLVYDKFVQMLDGNFKIVQANKPFNNYRYETIIEKGK